MSFSPNLGPKPRAAKCAIKHRRYYDVATYETKVTSLSQSDGLHSVPSHEDLTIMFNKKMISLMPIPRSFMP